MAARQLNEQAIFEVARKIDAREAREAYLLQICGDEAAIEQRVRALLKAYDENASFLESPAARLVATVNEQLVTEGPGTVIGPYTDFPHRHRRCKAVSGGEVLAGRWRT